MPATVWRGRLAFGLVSIPVRLYAAARRERIRFHHVHRQERAAEPPPPEIPLARSGGPVPIDAPRAQVEGPPPVERIRQEPTSVSEERPLAPQEILKGFEYEKDRYVVLERHELAALRPATSSELEIAQFLKLEEIDPLYFDASYYAAADRGGEKPYALLFSALRESGYAALGGFAMHGREHAAVIRPGLRGLMLHTLFYANEIREADEYAADPALVSGKELDLAKAVVQTLAAPFQPEKLRDPYEQRLRELIERRAASGLVAAAGREERQAPPPAMDLLAALRQTLEAARKPPAREEKPGAPRKGRTKRE